MPRQPEMDIAYCGACGEVTVIKVIASLPAGVTVGACNICHTRSLRPTPSAEAISNHYSQYYLTRNNESARITRLVDMHAGILDYLLAHLPAGNRYRFLDIGFGNGAFLLQVAARGHLAFGADVSAQNIRQLETMCAAKGASISTIDISSDSYASLGCESFDVITLFQVIEHMAEPRTQLQQLAAFQKSGDLLYLECPNDNALFARLKNTWRWLPNRKRMWRSLKYPEHLNGFSRHSISTVLEKAGYRVEACGDYAYLDGVHQVEAEFWWPRVHSALRDLSPVSLLRSAVPLFDKAASTLFGAGSGLFALARRL